MLNGYKKFTNWRYCKYTHEVNREDLNVKVASSARISEPSITKTSTGLRVIGEESLTKS